ncbi:MAG: ATP-binding protein, partial [archaeon]
MYELVFTFYEVNKRMPNVIIDPNQCTGCQACISACPNGVFEMQGDKAVVVNPSACDGCRV